MHLLLAATALAESYTENLSGNAEYDDCEDLCVANVYTADHPAVITGVEIYLKDVDSGMTRPPADLVLWTEASAGRWTAEVVDEMEALSASSYYWIGDTGLSISLSVGTRYAIGLCSNDGVGFTYDDTGDLDHPYWGTQEGYASWAESARASVPSALTSAPGVFMRVTFTASDEDRDGHDFVEDCDDGDAGVNPYADEVWYDGVDGDCSGGSDDDQDGDGYDLGQDCDDEAPLIHPGVYDAPYDGQDADCDGSSDYDADGDGDDAQAYGGGDCADTDPDVHSAAEEVWYDGFDQDCSGTSDFDQDGDGHDTPSAGGDDCDDTDARYTTDCTGWEPGDDTGGTDDDDEDEDEDEDDGGAGGCLCSSAGGGALSLLAIAAVVPLTRRRQRRG